MGRFVWGLGGCFGLGGASFGFARRGWDLGVMGFGDVVVGIWARAVWVRGLVGRVFGLGVLC